MVESELRSAIRYQINEYIPIPVEEAIIDIQIISEHVNSRQERMMDVLVVAARKEMVENTVAALEKAGLKPEIEAEEFNENVPAGKVIRQNPEAGAKLKKNGTVRLVLSKGSGKVAVPGGLVGQSASFVEAKLKEAGLNPERQPDAYSDTIEQGNVISVDPPSGTLVQKGSTVKYTVSKGPAPPKEVTVPDVSGLTIPEASARLEQAGLKLGSTTEQFSDSVPTGLVISQSPAAGQKVKEGSPVNITVSKGPQKTKVTVPNVEGMSQANAVSTLSAAGLLTNVTEVATLDPSKIGKVISQSPSAGSLVDEGSTVNITVGKVGP
jgi:serine/threonine-protein kinase